MSNKSTRIIEAAIKIFAKKGFYNATIADVAKTAEVAEGTIYLYFKNKDDLLISIFEHSIDLFIQTVNKKLKEITDPKEKLRQFIGVHLRLVEENPNLAQVLQIELRQSSKFMKEYRGGKFGEYLHLVEGILIEGQKQGLFREDLNTHLARRALFGAVDEIALDWLLMKKKRYSLDDCAAQVSQMLIEGMAE
ncbi:MAG: TetR/AcrR family transcriptional regulator [Deltaproteobacteria bacterium]|nr:TetR/AcrR family transcriptional regulator [Deltaproteobacteria bacterium]MBI4374687.1 TetR/AcrR family transcriptional regulator [Deltaproteobacteria bacterium]